MRPNLRTLFAVVCISITTLFASNLRADEVARTATRPKRLLLLGQRADSHPRTTHEYMAGVRLISRFLQADGRIQVVVVQADGPWEEGLDLLDHADGAFLYLTEGARWVSDDPHRLAAFQRLAKRGGGLSALHWGMGTRESAPVESFVSLFGGCHGGPDRKYKVGDFELLPLIERHPVTSGIKPFAVYDELYFALKFPKQHDGFHPLIQARGAEVDHPVAWTWERPDSGRSFGFTGMHFHENWKKLEYRRLIIQGVLWTLNESIPEGGMSLDISSSELSLPEEKSGDR
jgi:hypothetical protein